MNGINSTYLNWHTRRLTFHLFVQPEALCHSLSLARLFRCQTFFQFEISNSCCWPYVMHTGGVINVIKNPAVINRLKHSSSCTTCCNTENICFLCTDCVYVFHVVLTVNIDYFPNSIFQLVFVMERQSVCSCRTYQLHKFQAFCGCSVLMHGRWEHWNIGRHDIFRTQFIGFIWYMLTTEEGWNMD